MSGDTDDHDDRAGRTSKLRRLSRRRMLSTLGAAGAAGLAGCSGTGGQTTEADGNTETAMTTGTQQAAQEPADDGVDPRFGYVGTDPEATPPVEPDHTVAMNIRPRDGAEIPVFYFEPTGLFVEPGDTVRFQMNTPHHNVNAYHPGIGYNQRVPDGVAPFSSPVMTPGDYWLYTFEQEGVYDYMCAPHEIFGMVGRVVAGSATGPGANPVGEAPGPEQARPPEFTAALVYGDEAMAPANIVEQETVGWSDIAQENKRLTLVPAEE